MMRHLIMVMILCLTSTPAFTQGCILESDCNAGTTCVDGACIRGMGSGDDQDYKVPPKSETAKGAKSCLDNSDCSQGSSCVKGSGSKGVCIGN